MRTAALGPARNFKKGRYHGGTTIYIERRVFFFVIKVINSKNKRKSSSNETSERVGSLLVSSEAEDNAGPDYSSPSKKVKGDFSAARP